MNSRPRPPQRSRREGNDMEMVKHMEHAVIKDYGCQKMKSHIILFRGVAHCIDYVIIENIRKQRRKGEMVREKKWGKRGSDLFLSFSRARGGRVFSMMRIVFVTKMLKWTCLVCLFLTPKMANLRQQLLYNHYNYRTNNYYNIRLRPSNFTFNCTGIWNSNSLKLQFNTNFLKFNVQLSIMSRTPYCARTPQEIRVVPATPNNNYLRCIAANTVINIFDLALRPYLC